jgi:adenosyl cobinamide kinase/adenosyl cobinamide phosphate guanylyltransferase
LRTPPGVTLLLGGARCGKSDLAVRLAAEWGGPVTVVVTADAVGDDDLTARVERHRRERPSEWTTVEAPRDVAAAIDVVDERHLVVVDCVTIWVSNLMENGLDERGAYSVADELLAVLHARRTPSIVVTNEVGMGVHPATAVGRGYRDVLGRVNRRLSEGATSAWLVVAGRLVALTAPEDVFR